MRRPALVAATLTLGFAILVGCTGEENKGGAVPAGSADCSTAVKYEGTVYVEAGFSTAETEPLGDAQLAQCNDTGDRDDVGLTFPDDPDLVTVAAFTGQNQIKVIALGYQDADGPLYRVMINEELSNKETEAIQARLATS